MTEQLAENRRGVCGGDRVWEKKKLAKEKNWRRNVTIALLVGRRTNDEQGKLGWATKPMNAGRLIWANTTLHSVVAFYHFGGINEKNISTFKNDVFSCVHYFSVAVNSRYINPPSGQSNLQVDNTLLQRRQGHDNFFLQSQYVSSVCVYLTKATYFRQAVIYFSGAKRTTVEV